MIDLLEPFWNLLFPPHCPLCHAYVSRRGEWCEVCLPLACMPHRIPLSSSMREAVDPVWALGLYRDRLRPLIYRLKYRKQKAVLPYLTTLIGALQAVTGVVLTAYYHKAKAENTKGGITYDAALGVPNSETGDL